MERKEFFGFALVSLLVLTSVAIIINQSDQEFQRNLTDNSSSEKVKTTEDGTRYLVNPSELVQGCPGKECIPSIDNPEFETPEEADQWLSPDERVIGIERENESKAYPLKILRKHEIVNDEISGEPVVVTYCPLCRSGLTYSRIVKGDTLEFGVSGKLLDANLVMYDRGTESYWNQIQGKAIVGPRVPQELELEFSSITEWEEWKEAHPETKVLSINTGIYSPSRYERNPYSGFNESERVGFGVKEVDDRLPSKEIVYGVDTGGVSKAYPEKTVRNEKIIQDRVGDKPLVIFERPDDGTITALVREQSGETLNLKLEEKGLRDSEGGFYSFDGKKADGSVELQKMKTQGFYWFAWSKFRPETRVYRSTS